MKGSTQLWLALGWVALIVVGLAAGVAPRFRALDRLDQDAVALVDRAERADDGAAELARLEARLAAAREASSRIKRIPLGSDVAGLIRELTSMLDDLGMSEREITTGSTEDVGDASSTPMTVRMRGPFLGVQESIRWIESLPRLIRVMRIKVETPRTSRQSLGERFGVVQAELVLNVFFDETGDFAMDDAVAGAEDRAR